MTCSEFWLNVLANFIPDFLVGGFIALIIALILKDKDKKELALEKSKIREQKIIDYLTEIMYEIIDIDNKVKIYHKNNDYYK